MTRRRPGEPLWAPMMRLRTLDDGRYKGTSLATIFPQFRMSAEGNFGNQSTALQLEDRSGLARRQPGTYSIPLGARAVEATSVISRLADSTSVIMINERHHVPASRILTLRLLPTLFAKGYRYLAVEAVASADSGLRARGYPLEGVSGREAVSGAYTDEPVFGTLLREAIRIGYRIVPYEMDPAQDDTVHGPSADLWRDSVQAANLYERIFRQDPQAKVLVHAGYGHIDESPNPERATMAVLFRRLSGIDPLTVDQTALAEHSDSAFESPIYRSVITAGLLRDRAVVLVDSVGVPFRLTSYPADVQVITPRSGTDSHGRPSFMSALPQRRAMEVAIPECGSRTCIVEVRRSVESDSAVALDRVEATRAVAVVLFVPAFVPYRLSIRDGSTGAVLRSINSPSSRGQ